ncbi:MAG TPA: PhoU domain-containing protein, partial [Spirochaetota bacterium]
LGRQHLTPEISVGIPMMLQTVNGLENSGDYSEVVLECLRRKKEGNVYFSDSAMNEIRDMAAKVIDMLDLVTKVFDDPENELAVKARFLRESIAQDREELKRNHTSRLSEGECTVIAGLLYIDIISAFDKIADLSLEIIKEQRSTT